MKGTRLLHTEWLKVRKYWAFWGVFALVLIAYPGISYLFYTGYQDLRSSNRQMDAILKFTVGSPFGFPEIWHTLAYIASFLVFIPGVLVIMLITNEYQYRTQRQNILDGWSRDQFLWSKVIDIAALSILLSLVYAGVVLITGWANPEIALSGIQEKSYFIGLFALITFNQLTIAFLFGFLFKRALLALGFFLFYFLIPENILIQLSRWRWHTGNWYHYLPLEASDRLIPPPPYLARISNPTDYQLMLDSIPKHIVISIGYTCLLWFFCFWWLRRKDLT
jgi:ABC-type transport system involved in multi-copper enzyme maturation permease subunit